MAIEAGHLFKGPKGTGYRLKKRLSAGDVMTAAHFEPFGGAPQLYPGDIIPKWLADRLRRSVKPTA